MLDLSGSTGEVCVGNEARRGVARGDIGSATKDIIG